MNNGNRGYAMQDFSHKFYFENSCTKKTNIISE